MTQKHYPRAVLAAAGLVLMLGAGVPAQAADPAKPALAPMGSTVTTIKEEWLIPTGVHWMKSTEVEKQSYVLGILNMAMVEYQLTGAAPRHRTSVPGLVKGLEGMTVFQVVDALNDYYKANPGNQQKPVIEAIWGQVVKPRLDQSKVK